MSYRKKSREQWEENSNQRWVVDVRPGRNTVWCQVLGQLDQCWWSHTGVCVFVCVCVCVCVCARAHLYPPLFLGLQPWETHSPDQERHAWVLSKSGPDWWFPIWKVLSVFQVIHSHKNQFSFLQNLTILPELKDLILLWVWKMLPLLNPHQKTYIGFL